MVARATGGGWVEDDRARLGRRILAPLPRRARTWILIYEALSGSLVTPQAGLPRIFTSYAASSRRGSRSSTSMHHEEKRSHPQFRTGTSAKIFGRRTVVYLLLAGPLALAWELAGGSERRARAAGDATVPADTVT